MNTIIYFWYDHLLLRETGEAEIVQSAIENHDYASFMNIYNKYPPYKDSDGYFQIFFPNTACIFNENYDLIGEIDITKEEGFNLIDSSDYECG